MLLRELGAKRAAFFFVERDDIARSGQLELLATIARWYTPGDPFSATPDVLPVWCGSYLPFEAAFDRFAFFDVHVTLVGCASEELRARLVEHVTQHPPVGMFAHDADANEPDLPLVFKGAVLPNALVYNGEVGRKVDHATRLDIIGFDSDEDQFAFDIGIKGVPGEEELDGSERALLRLLAARVGRRLPSAQAADGFEALCDQAFELFGLGAVSAAGAVAGVAFEQLMKRALTGDAAAWLGARDEAGQHTKLAHIIDKYGSETGVNTSRLQAFRDLRNDLAHRLGDEHQAQRTPEELWQAVDELLRWLDDQSVTEDGLATLVDVGPDPAVDLETLLAEALAAGDKAAEAASPPLMRIGDDKFEAFGFAWVIVRGPRREFTRWLLAEDAGREHEQGAQLQAPGRGFERNLAWAHAVTERLRQAGHVCDYSGWPD